MNPSAREFVPTFLKAPAAATPPPQKTAAPAQAPAPVKAEPQTPPPKKVEAPKPVEPKKSKPNEENWETKTEENPKPSSDSDKIEGELRKELSRIAMEEGTSVEALLNEKELNPDELPEEPKEKEDTREHLNIVFIGHVDAGKSTISGQILFMTGQVDQRTIQKYEKEAKENNRESWFLAYIMDTNEEERAKGKTVEVGRANFETESKRYTILDAPGHKNYVPNMIAGAAQADIAVLVISAKKGEFESGFHKGGQTREHAMLAKIFGLKTLVVAVNKMDDPSVGWAKERYDEIVKELTPFFRTVGYNPKTDVIFIPISGFKGVNMIETVSKDVCPWYDGESLFKTLDKIKPPERNAQGPVRMPVVDKYRDRNGTQILGKVEWGTINKGDQLILMPNKTSVEVLSVTTDTKTLRCARPGENIKILVKGVDEEGVHRGFVVCDPRSPVKCQTRFEAQLAILDLLPHKSVFTAGYSAVIHIHTAVEECSVIALVAQLDKKTAEITKKKPSHVTSGSLLRCIIECSQPVCLELFSDVPQLGRFTLRDEGKTIAIGKVTALGPKKAAQQQQKA